MYTYVYICIHIIDYYRWCAVDLLQSGIGLFCTPDSVCTKCIKMWESPHQAIPSSIEAWLQPICNTAWLLEFRFGATHLKHLIPADLARSPPLYIKWINQWQRDICSITYLQPILSFKFPPFPTCVFQISRLVASANPLLGVFFSIFPTFAISLPSGKLT